MYSAVEPNGRSRHTLLGPVVAGALVVMLAAASGAQPPPDTRCNNPGTCDNFESCNTSDPDCGGQGVCSVLAEGGGFCVNGSLSCAGLTLCTTTADCPADSFCGLDSCCGPGVCAPLSALCEGVIEESTTAAPVLSSTGVAVIVVALIAIGVLGLRYRSRGVA